MNKYIYIFGNDTRYEYVRSMLKDFGFNVLTGLNDDIKPDVFLLPISGFNSDSKVNDVIIDDSFFNTYSTSVFVSGINTVYLTEMKNKYDLRMIILNDHPDFTNVNSVATAEGVLALILGNKKKILSDLTIMILGYGKSGKAIADLLTRNKVKTVIVARSELSRVEAYTMSKYVISFDDMNEQLENTDIIVNTVPSFVVTKEVMEKCRKDVYIIDIATKPGGVDYEAARELGVKAYLAPGLPSVYAPYSSAASLVNTLIKEL